MARNFDDYWKSNQADLEKHAAFLEKEGLKRKGRTISVTPGCRPLEATRTKAQMGWENFQKSRNTAQKEQWLPRLLEGILTPFEECWSDHSGAIHSRTEKLRYPNNPVGFDYGGDLTADTCEAGKKEWSAFQDASDLELEAKWLITIHRHLFLERWRERRSEETRIRTQFDRFKKRHTAQEALEGKSENSLYMTQEEIARRRRHLADFEKLAIRQCNGDQDRAEDLINETFIAAYDIFPSFLDLGNEDKERTFLMSVLKNRLIDDYRQQVGRNKRTQGPMQSVDDPNVREIHTPGSLEDNFTQWCFKDLLNKLENEPAGYTGTYVTRTGQVRERALRSRDIEALRYSLDGYTLSEIGKKLNVAIATVHESLHIATSVVANEFRNECL